MSRVELLRRFRLTAADVGAKMVVAVTADNSALPSGGTATATSSPTATVVSVAAPPGDPVVATAGDIACDPTFGSYNGGLGTLTACRQKYTSDLLVGGGLAAVLALGDNQYECAGFNAFRTAYDPSWGRVKSITRPAVGNHEYNASFGTDCDSTAHAKGYFDYFNGKNNFSGPAGDRTKAYYSYDVGSLASDRPELHVQHRRRLWRRLPGGGVAPQRPRLPSVELHACLLAPPRPGPVDCRCGPISTPRTRTWS